MSIPFQLVAKAVAAQFQDLAASRTPVEDSLRLLTVIAQIAVSVINRLLGTGKVTDFRFRPVPVPFRVIEVAASEVRHHQGSPVRGL